jgi:hypothetical protein
MVGNYISEKLVLQNANDAIKKVNGELFQDY